MDVAYAHAILAAIGAQQFKYWWSKIKWLEVTQIGLW